MQAYIRIIAAVIVFFGLGVGLGVSYANMQNEGRGRNKMKLGRTESSMDFPPPVSLDDEIYNTLEQLEAGKELSGPSAGGGSQGSRVFRREEIPIEPGAVRVWHHEASHKMVAELEGKIVTLNEGLTPLQKERLTAFSIDLAQLLSVDFEKLELSSKEKTPAVPSPISLFTPANLVKGFSRTQLEVPETPTSLAGQINAVLQSRLVNTPFDKRGIRIVEGPDGNVVFQVGMDRYQSMDEIPDEEVRNVIRSAVEKWQEDQ